MAYSEKLAVKALNASVSMAIEWDHEQVGEWIAEIGFPQYRNCFVDNYIYGKKLIFIDQSSLPKIGITDYLHMKSIFSALKDLLKIEDPDYRRSIALPERERMAAFLLDKSNTGKKADALTFMTFLRRNRDKYKMPERAN